SRGRRRTPDDPLDRLGRAVVDHLPRGGVVRGPVRGTPGSAPVPPWRVGRGGTGCAGGRGGPRRQPDRLCRRSLVRRCRGAPVAGRPGRRRHVRRGACPRAGPATWTGAAAAPDG